MTASLSLILYGRMEAYVKAKAVLENLPQVKRIDSLPDEKRLTLLLSEQLHENSLIPLLAQSGISGFRLLESDQNASRNGWLLSL